MPRSEAGARFPAGEYLFKSHLFIVKRLQWKAFQQIASELTGAVLDIGAGRSAYRPLIAPTRYVSLDSNRELRPTLIGSAMDMPFRADSFDSLICTEVLEHLPDPDRALRECHRVLKRAGKVYVTVPMSWNLHYEPHDYWRFTKYGLELMLREAGFTVTRCERIGGLFALVGSRLVDGISAFIYFRSPLRRLPRRVRYAVTLAYSIPASLVFWGAARLFDDFEASEAIGWAVLAQKND